MSRVRTRKLFAEAERAGNFMKNVDKQAASTALAHLLALAAMLVIAGFVFYAR
jgi:hypothetical protein